jgi:hypothetical protein
MSEPTSDNKILDGLDRTGMLAETRPQTQSVP